MPELCERTFNVRVDVYPPIYVEVECEREAWHEGPCRGQTPQMEVVRQPSLVVVPGEEPGGNGEE